MYMVQFQFRTRTLHSWGNTRIRGEVGWCGVWCSKVVEFRTRTFHRPTTLAHGRCILSHGAGIVLAWYSTHEGSKTFLYHRLP